MLQLRVRGHGVGIDLSNDVERPQIAFVSGCVSFDRPHDHAFLDPLEQIANGPTRTASLSANCTTGKSLASILITAISVFSSLPTTLAENSRPSFSFTSILSAASTTWKLVKM